MTKLFFGMVNLSIQAGWLVLVILLFRVFLHKAPRWIFPLLWGLVGIRLLVPFSIESAWSLIPSAETVPDSVLTAESPAIHSGFSAVNQAINPVLGETLAPATGASVNPAQVLASVLSWIWAIGAVGMLLYLVISWGRLSHRVRTAVRLRDNIYQSEQIPSPFVFGLWNPRILLPFSLSEKDRPFVIAHEQSHIRRGDPWVKALAFFLLSIYWFHPLIWLAYFLLCRDLELACDERVIGTLDRQGRAGYSQALLSCSTAQRNSPVCPLAFGESGVKTRVKAVLRYRKPMLWMTVAAALLIVIIAVCFLTTPQTRPALEWAQNLSADEIKSIELVVMPQATDKQYRLFQEKEFPGVAALINGSHGQYVEEPENLAGGSILFSITTTDGEKHTVSNLGNAYLYIDGDTFAADYNWLSSWDREYGEGNAPLPDGYGNEETTGSWRWFDILLGEEPVSDGRLETVLAEFPGVSFVYNGGSVTADDGKETVSLYQGMPVWNVYFADLNGDGLREICSSAAYGSGLIDTRILVYDYANREGYELSDRGVNDYGLLLQDGQLWGTITPYESASYLEPRQAEHMGLLVLVREDGETLLRIEE